MNAHSNFTGTSVIPTVRYRDVPAAVEWLQEALGFVAHRLVKEPKGSVIYGELTFGTGMVMVAPIQESPFGKLMVQPDEIGGVETQICYLLVGDARAHYDRAKAAGAEIVLDIEDKANGGRGYSCRDLEGHVWNFGTHNPWTARNAASASRRSRRILKVLAACSLLAVTGLYMHTPAREAAGDFALAIFGKISGSIESAQAEQIPDDFDDSAGLKPHNVREQLARERLARVAADQQVKDIREQLVQERRAREAAELAVKEARERQVQDPRPGAAVKAAEAAAAEARGNLAKARDALQAVAEQLAETQHGAKEAREQFAQLRTAREAAEQTAREARALAMRERRMRMAAQRRLKRAVASSYTPYPPQ